MSPCAQYGERPVVLLTNDDGPPGPSSPNIYGFSQLLQERLGWEVRVVIPDCQKSWVGKAYAISDIITISYFYPLGPDGLTGDVSDVSRPLKDGETMEWVLVSGTPATCSNIALHNLYPGQIDMVISGPNHGRNSSTAFALSSGTIGAALAAAMSVPLPGPSTSTPSLHLDHIPAIAVSYGVIARPVPEIVSSLAHEAAVEVCERLWNDWGYEQSSGGQKRKVQLYTVNIPLQEDVLVKENRKMCWTTMWRNYYGQLFKPTKLESTTFEADDDRNKNQKTINQPSSGEPAEKTATSTAGPGALPSKPASPAPAPKSSGQQKFRFGPTMGPLLTPRDEDLPVGTDAWAFAKGYISVAPIRAEFGGLLAGGCGFGSDQGKEQVYGSFWDEPVARM